MISVIIPVLNEEKMLSETLQHVLIQPGEYEIIVVDGGSVDRTCEIRDGLTIARDRSGFCSCTPIRGSRPVPWPDSIHWKLRTQSRLAASCISSRDATGDSACSPI